MKKREEGLSGWHVAAATLLLALIAQLPFLEHPAAFTVWQTGFGFGPLARNIAEHGWYGVTEFRPGGGQIALHVHRLPLVPLLLALFGKLGFGGALAYFTKNLLAFGLVSWAAARLTRHLGGKPWVFWSLALCLLLNPFALQTIGSFDVEEGYFIPLLIAALALLLTGKSSRDPLALALLCAGIVLTKSSLAPLGGGLAVVGWFAFRKLRFGYAPVVGVTIALVGWGLFGQAASGRFTFGLNSSSWNGWNYYKGNNPKFNDYYPYRNLDELDVYAVNPSSPLTDEWSLNDDFMRRAAEFRSQHPDEVREALLSKLSMAFWRVDGIKHIATVPDGVVWPQIVLARLWAWGMCIFALLTLARRPWRKDETLLVGAGAFVVIYATLAAPYVAGFGYHRHFAPVYAAATFLAAFLLIRRKVLTSSTDCSFDLLAAAKSPEND